MSRCMPHVTSCCCCFTLRSGALIVASLHILLSVSLVAICSLYTAQFGVAAQADLDRADDVYATAHIVSLIATLASVAHLLLGLTLLYALYEGSVCCIRVWVFVMLSLLAASLSFIVISTLARGVGGTGSDMFLAMLRGILFFSTVIYCVIVVNSYYMQLSSAEPTDGPESY